MKALQLNTDTGEIESTSVLSPSDAADVPTPGAIPIADSNGTLDRWIAGPLPITTLPVADDCEVSSAKVVRADDSRLGNPAVGGDISGTAAAAVVTGIRGRAVANEAPLDGQALAWDAATNRWMPKDVGGDAGNATQIQGRAVTDTTPSVGDTLVWDGSSWTPSAGGGGTIAEHVAIAAALWLQQQRPFG